MLAALALALGLGGAPAQGEPAAVVVHSVCDLSQEFTFYIDGRFHRQYLEGVGRDARNWGSLHRLDLENVNLLVLTGAHWLGPVTPLGGLGFMVGWVLVAVAAFRRQ